MIKLKNSNFKFVKNKKLIKLTKSIYKLAENTKINFNCVKTEDAIKIHSNKMNMIVDIRDIIEITKSDRILGAKHIPRVI